MSVIRTDRGELTKPVRMDNGWLRAPARLTRTGIFEYRNPDGSVRRELRLPEEVFHSDSLASFAMLPITDGHPAEPLDAENTRELQRGNVGELVRRDGDFVAASMLITAADLVGKVLTKEKVEVSCGYQCDLEEVPGEYRGERYDAIQRNIRGNHVAIVDRGRAGPEVRVRVDRVDGVHVQPGQSQNTSGEEPGGTVKIRIDGVEFEGTEQLAQALAREDAKHTEALAAKDTALKSTSAEVEKLKARVDSLQADLTKAEQARKDAADPAKLAEVVRARVALEKRAGEVLGAETKLDGMSEAEISVEMLKKLEPELKLDGKSAEYIQAALDIALEKRGRTDSEEALRDVRRATEVHTDGNPIRADQARAKFYEESRDAWKKPLSATKADALR